MAAAGKLVALARNVERIAGQDPGTERKAGRRFADPLLLREIGVSDAGDLQSRRAGHLGHAERRPRWWVVREELGVVLVDLGVLVVVFQVDVRLDHVLHVHAGQLQRLADLVQAILDLSLGILVGLVVSLPRDIQRLADHDAGAKRPVGRRPFGVMNFFSGAWPKVACARPTTITTGARTIRPVLLMTSSPSSRMTFRLEDRRSSRSVAKRTDAFHRWAGPSAEVSAPTGTIACDRACGTIFRRARVDARQ